MKALVLAAGYATRLYPLTKEYPKPLLLVKERPLIDYIIDKLDVLARLEEIIVVTNSKFIGTFRKWAGGVQTGKRLTLVDDRTTDLKSRRGAIGDMAFAIEERCIDDDLLVIGGDNLFEDSLEGFLRFAGKHRAHPAIGVYDIQERLRARRYGVVRLDAGNRVVDFAEKPEHPASTLVATCLYYLPRKKLALVGEYMRSRSEKHDATGFFIDWLRKQEPVYGFTFKRQWFDIGHLEFYNEAKRHFQAEIKH